MAGINYRSCTFDDPLATAVSNYRESTVDKHDAFRTQAANVATNLALYSSFDDISTRLLTLMKLYGVTSTDTFRQALGFHSRLTTRTSFELWVLEFLGIAIVNGMYVARSRGAVAIAPYRTVYDLIGLSALEAALLGAETGDFAYYIEYDGVIYSNTPPSALMQTLGVSFSALTTYFVWFGAPNIHARRLLRAQGFPGDELYRVVRGQDSDNITTVTLTRLDFLSQLRSMGYTDADITALLDRDIDRVLIDTQRLRADDNNSAITGVYQTYPFPGELAASLTDEVNNLPSVGQLRTTAGARVYMPPLLAVVKALDPARSFPTKEYNQSIADKPDNENVASSQAYFAVIETQIEQLNKSWDVMVDAVVSTATDWAENIETFMAFFGMDLPCGRSLPEGWPNMGDLTVGDLLDRINLAEADLQDLFGVATSQISRATSLLETTVGGLDTLSCGAISLDCIATNQGGTGEAEGGVYDESGNVMASLFDAEEVVSALTNMTSGTYGAFGDLSNAMYAAANIINARQQQCAKDTDIRTTSELVKAATAGQ